MAADKTLATLRIQFPDGSQRSVEVRSPSFTAGRAPDGDLQLPDPKISRQHFRLLFEGDRIQLVDLKSSNGTFVGETRLTPNQPHPIAFGQAFSAGPYRMELVSPPEKVPERPKTRKAPAPKERPAEKTIPPAKPKPEPKVEKAPEPAVKIGAEKAPVPAAEPTPRTRRPAAPPAPPPPEGPTLPSLGEYDHTFGVPGDRSRYLQYLPPIFEEHPFLGSFLLAFEGVLAPIEQSVDHFDAYLDPETTPPFFLENLASWLGVILDEKWPLEKRRAVVAEAAELYRKRGTRQGLSRWLEIYTEVTPEIAEPKGQPHHFEVVLNVPRGKNVDQATVERIIEANKPAHATYGLKIVRGKSSGG